MTGCLTLNKTNCKNCYKCIRHCPIKSIRFSNQRAEIIPEECIYCGECYVCCPQSAKEVRNDLNKAKQLIADGHKVIASIAPSFISDFDGLTIKSFEVALEKLGFFAVEETAIGATIVKNEYSRLTHEGNMPIIISSCCHSVNLLIQKHYPDALQYLAHVLSPMQMHSKDIKRRYPDAKTVFIGPCIAKKDEVDMYPGIVDCALTFDELRTWLNDSSVALERVDDDNDNSLARLFPTTGGILRTMEDKSDEYTYMTIEGVEDCGKVLEDIVSGKVTRKCFIEMSACHGSCIGGPITARHSRARGYLLVDDYAGKKDFEVEEMPAAEMDKDMPSLAPLRVKVSSSTIDDILKQIGKVSKEHELNCGGCGYDTCRLKAEAVVNGKADLNMCLPYLKEKAESFSDIIIKNMPNAVIVLNENMEVEQLNASACKMMNIKNPNNVLHNQVVRILNPRYFMDVYLSGKNVYNVPEYLPEYKRHVRMSVIHDRTYHIIIGIMRDETDTVTQREEREELNRKTIEVTEKIIEKQMRAVQEIASLLGESTAETKVALTKLRDSLAEESEN